MQNKTISFLGSSATLGSAGTLTGLAVALFRICICAGCHTTEVRQDMSGYFDPSIPYSDVCTLKFRMFRIDVLSLSTPRGSIKTDSVVDCNACWPECNKTLQVFIMIVSIYIQAFCPCQSVFVPPSIVSNNGRSMFTIDSKVVIVSSIQFSLQN